MGPACMTTERAVSFFESAGYVKGECFDVIEHAGRFAIIPKTQMTLAQDAIKLGFKIVERKAK